MLLGSLVPHDHWSRKAVAAEPMRVTEALQRRQPASSTQSVSSELLCPFPSKMELGLCCHSDPRLCTVSLVALSHTPLGT